MVKKQITRFVTEDKLTYKQIARSLVYYLEVKQRPHNPDYGIGFVPAVFPDANAYYEREGVKLRQRQAEGNKLKKVYDTPKNRVKVKATVRKHKNKKLIDITEIGGDYNGDK
jgi:hypothetical protein